MAQYKPRPNVSGGAGGERFDHRANVKEGAKLARRLQDAAEIAEAIAPDEAPVEKEASQ